MPKIISFDTDIEIQHYKEKILENELKIINQYPAKTIDFKEDFDGQTGLGYNSLTSRSCHFNLLDWDGVDSLKECIKKNYNFFMGETCESIYVQCWANVMRRGEQIKPHAHRDSETTNYYHSLTGNLMIDVDEESYTFYENVPVLNKPGRMVLFPSDLVHWTSVYSGETQRISIAFDIKNYKDWEEEVNDAFKYHWVKI